MKTSRIDEVDRPKKWRARYTAGSCRYSKTFATKREAESWLAAQKADHDRGEWADPRGGKVTLAEWWPAFLESLPPDRAAKTVGGYERIWRLWVEPEFGMTALNEVTVERVQRWLNAIRAVRSADTARQARQLLSAMLKLAAQRGRISRNPVSLVRSPRTTPRRQLILDPFEVEAMAADADARRPFSGDVIRFMAATGIRFGEAVALRISSVDLETGAVAVERSATEGGGRLVEGPTKSRKARTVYVGPVMAARLRRHVEGEDPDGRVFRAAKGGPLRVGPFRRGVWDPARLVLPPSKRDVTPHDLRDAYAVHSIRAGADLIEVSRALGHSSPAVTAAHYADAFDASRARRRAAELEAASENVVSISGKRTGYR